MSTPEIPALPYPSYHWIVPHHFSKMLPEVIVDTLPIFPKYNGEHIGALELNGQRIPSSRNPVRVALNKEIGILLTANVRSDMGISEPFRDYQQLFYHLGILYPHHLVGNCLQVGELALDTSSRLDLSAFFLLQAMGYQSPNGASESRALQPYLSHQVTVKPILMIYQVLMALTKILGEAALLYQDEIVTFLAPQCNHNDINRIAQLIIDARSWHPQFGEEDLTLPHRYSTDTRAFYNERKRSVAECITFMRALPLFHVFDQEMHGGSRRLRRAVQLRVQELEDIGVIDIQALAMAEEKHSSFFTFRDSSARERLRWFDYYTSRDRLQRWYDQRDVLVQHSEPYTIQSPNRVQDAPSTEILPKNTIQSPEKNRHLQEQRREMLQQMRTRLAQIIEINGGILLANPSTIDFDVRMHGFRFFFEIKCLLVKDNKRGVVLQTREAIGQLLEYQYRVKEEGTVVCVVFDRYPNEHEWVIDFLRHVQILVCWWDATLQRFMYPENDQHIFHRLQM